MPRLIALLATACFLIPLDSQAQGRFEITPYAAYSMGGSFSDTEDIVDISLVDSQSFGMILNMRHTAQTQWEFIYSQQNTDARIRGGDLDGERLDTDVRYYQLGGTYQGEGQLGRPFMSATLGVSQFDVREPGYDSETYFGFSIGGGLQMWPTNRLGVRLEARAFGTLVRSDSSLFCSSDPGGGQAGCALTLAGDVLWQFQAMAGLVFRF